jgi:hypothetical protein
MVYVAGVIGTGTVLYMILASVSGTGLSRCHHRQTQPSWNKFEGNDTILLWHY